MFERKLLTAICLVVVLVALGTVVYILATNQFHDVDGLMQIAVYLMIALIFGAISAPELSSLMPEFPPAVDELVYQAAGHGEHGGGSTPLYMMVWGGLLALTIVEVALAYFQLAVVLMLVALMCLSIVKAALIIAYFMHLRFERLSLVLTLMPVLVMCICLLGMFFPDSLRVVEMGTR